MYSADRSGSFMMIISKQKTAKSSEMHDFAVFFVSELLFGILCRSRSQ